MLSIFVTFLGAFLTLIVMRPLANWIGLVDKPNYRKRHQGTIPLIGGVSLFCWKSLLLFDGMGSTSITVSLFVQYFCFIGDWDFR
ncbi:undecaprenyl-phosphate alpha-N-acetylglucosaminyl 1-phosphate transferase [Haemophilus influenzae 22.4-21]|uniref:Undecaprenyl-phosphate alpha-N-acetylglucosaminyl 1-phosphate transferase n=1 Tax=Haemophilus influenzae 22.4-21 TaxID=375063 RepID=A4NXF7_HAEIF|nr:undecaprenyl-phosphate alpha-N-acetylglucosaminyl 1-phosphate transferase [Haemophilus influenzae 22.4-21]